MKLRLYYLLSIVGVLSLLGLTACEPDNDYYDGYYYHEGGRTDRQIDILGTWRTYYKYEDGSPKGWAEFNFDDNGRFQFYDYFAVEDSLSMETGNYQFTTGGFTVKFDRDASAQTYDYKWDDKQLTFFYPHQEQVTYYLIADNERRLTGNWQTIDRRGNIVELSLGTNHTLYLKKTTPNKVVSTGMGHYDAAEHVMRIWWAQADGLPAPPEIWYYAVDRNTMYNSYNGGALWERPGTSSLRSVKAKSREEVRKAFVYRPQWLLSLRKNAEQ